MKSSAENRLKIYIPQIRDLWFRQKMMADKNTMNYNVGFEPCEGYNPNDGTIAFAGDKWQKWFDLWLGIETVRKKDGGWLGLRDRFYAYIARKSDGKLIGDIAYRFDKDKDMHAVHIVIDNEFRGMGYSKEALEILCQNAKKNGVEKLYNDIPKNRIAAIKIHKAVGFKELENIGEYCFLVLQLIDYR